MHFRLTLPILMTFLIGANPSQSLGMASSATQPAHKPAWDNYADTWVATDGLGRSVATFAEAGEAKKDRFVGIFYFLWLDGKTPVHDLTKLLAENPTDPRFGPTGSFHFWGEPRLGYYRSDDRGVIRKHIQMLADAGVDVLIFDVTNGPTYPQVYLAVCDELSAMRALGQQTPGVAFIVHSKPDVVIGRLFDDFYAKNIHPELWFRWLGKPLLLGPPDAVPDRAVGFFTLRESWAWTKGQKWFGDGKDRWPWLDHTPQTPGWHDSQNKPEAISVATAEHPVSNIGRSFHGGKQPPPDQIKTDQGLYFAEQWKRVREVDPPFVFVTGWNEWVAQRFINPGGIKMLGKKQNKGDTYFVDTYSQEFSRDIEPMRGGHGDAYYYQLVDNIRRFKGVRPLPPITARPIIVDGTFADWKEVEPEFRDTIGDPVRRDHSGWKDQPPFKNITGRNDIVAAKVSQDSANVYFYVRTRDPISPATDLNWMLLYLDVDANSKTGWLGYDYVVNRANVRPNLTTIQRHTGPAGSYIWGETADIRYALKGNEMELVIPWSAFGPRRPTTIDFKWADNVGQTGEADQFSLDGDAAPNDRFNFRAVLTR